MQHRCLMWAGALGLMALGPAILAAAEGTATGVKLIEQPDKIVVQIGGELLTEYVFRGAPRPYYYPLLGPGGLPMTRHWPMKQVEGEDRDHPHHRSLWYSHGAVNGVDFWSEGPKAGRIVHDRFVELRSGAEFGLIRSANKWVTTGGEVVCTDERLFRVYARPNTERLFDFEITLKAGDREVVFGDTKEGTMAVRVAESMRLMQPKRKPGQGHIVLSTGLRDGQTWGKRAQWCDYHGPVQGRLVGIAIFDHPSNPAHPTWWHVRDYGLFAANPFGVHDFERKPPGTGNLVIAPGQSVTFKYRFYLHEGDEQQARVAERYRQYVAGGL